MHKTRDRIRALYYPYAYPRTVKALKYALLIFDELWFIDPLARDYRWALMYSEFGEAWNAIREALDYLVHKGLVKIYDPSNIVRQQDFELTTAIEKDIEDPLFSQISDVLRGGRWSVAIERLPPSMRHGDYAHGAIHGFLPIFHGFIMNLNLTLAVAIDNSHLDLIPFTDFDIAQHALALKYSRLAEKNSLESEMSLIPTRLSKRSPRQLFSYNALATNILYDLVPSEALDSLSIEQVVKYRERASDAMTALKSKILSLTADLTAGLLTPEFTRQVIEVVDAIRVEEQQAKAEMARIYRDMYRGTAVKSLATVLPSLVACVYSNASYEQMLAVGVSAFLGSVMTETAAAASAKASHQTNCLSFFLNLQKHRPLRFGRWVRVFSMSSKSRDKMITYLGQASKDEDVHVRRLAVGTLAEMEGRGSIKALKQALHDEDRSVRLRAIQALGKMRANISKNEWLRVLDKGELTDTVYKTLCQIGTKHAMQIIITQILADIENACKWRQALGWRALAEASEGKEDIIREMLADAIRRVKGASEKEDFVSPACWLVAKLGPSEQAEEFYLEIIGVSEEPGVLFHPTKHLLHIQELRQQTVSKLLEFRETGSRQRSTMIASLLLAKGIHNTEMEEELQQWLKILGANVLSYDEEKHMLAEIATGDMLSLLVGLVASDDQAIRRAAHNLLSSVAIKLECRYPSRGDRRVILQRFETHLNEMRVELDAYRASRYHRVLADDEWTRTDLRGHRYL